jgi:hypothetical protein
MTVAIDLDKASLPNDGVAEEDSVPPILESFIPETCLPDVIDVDVDYARFYGMYGNEDLWERVAARHAIKFVRQYPPRTLTNEGMFNNFISSQWLHPIHNGCGSLIRAVSGEQLMAPNPGRTAILPKERY